MGTLDRDQCAGCGTGLPERSPASPEVRRCQNCWWPHELSLPAAEQHPYARNYVPRQRRNP